MMRFTLPRDVYHGKGALEALKKLKGKKAVICVGGGSMKKFGFLDKAESYLKEAGMTVKIIDGIESDPSVETVMNGAKAMLDFGPDWIVAIGGGRQCGLNTNTPTALLRTCAKFSESQNSAKRQNSAPSRQHRELPPK